MTRKWNKPDDKKRPRTPAIPLREKNLNTIRSRLMDNGVLGIDPLLIADPVERAVAMGQAYLLTDEQVRAAVTA